MKTRDFLLVVMFALVSAMWAQDKLAQAPAGSGTGNQMRAEERQKMIEMRKEEMEGMRTDIEKRHENRHREDEGLARSDEGQPFHDQGYERVLTLARQRGYVGIGDYSNGQNAKEYGIDGARHDAGPWSGRPPYRAANRKET
jgi:hypothetical protein